MNVAQRILMCGCTESGFDLVKDLLECGITFCQFATISPEKANDQRVSGYKDFRPLADKYGIPVYQCDKYSLKSKRDEDFFRSRQFSVLVQGGWQRLFPDAVLNSLSIGAIGVHGSSELLPRGRGRSPINWSLIEGKRRFIFHYFLMKSGVDDGDVFHQEACDVNEWDDCKTLYYKNTIITTRVMQNWLPRLHLGEFSVVPQVGEPSYYLKRTEEDGRVNWEKNVFEIHNLIRGVTKPYPGAFCYLRGEKIQVWRAQPFDTQILFPTALPGEVIHSFGDGSIVVNCLSGLLLLIEYNAPRVLVRGDVLT